jgi:Lamin Tail Domain
MQNLRSLFLPRAAIAAACALAAMQASAAIVISEVDAAGSANSAYSADWFELTNTGSAAVSIAGWKMDDSSDSFSNAVALTGLTSISAGQSVVFLEDTGSTAATVNGDFISAWFGTHAPSGLTLGNYGGSGVGLSQSGDAVNIFDSSGHAVTGVAFNASSATGATFDNTAGLNSGTLTQFSVAGVNGAFNSLQGNEIGSPGINATPVPVPAALFLFLGGLGLVAPSIKKKGLAPA